MTETGSNQLHRAQLICILSKSHHRRYTTLNIANLNFAFVLCNNNNKKIYHVTVAGINSATANLLAVVQ